MKWMIVEAVAAPVPGNFTSGARSASNFRSGSSEAARRNASE
jgi:hypothetical protein